MLCCVCVLCPGILANVGLIAAGWFTRYVSYTLAPGNEVLSLQVCLGWLRGPFAVAATFLTRHQCARQPTVPLLVLVVITAPLHTLPSRPFCVCLLSQILTGAIIVMSCCMCVVKSYVDSSILPLIDTQGRGKKKDKQKKKEAAQGAAGEKTKKKASTWEVLTSSPRIFNLTLMVMGYGICHKLFGFVWKVTGSES